ncbi:MAG: hypothetical protein ACM3UU_11305 [Ignavibacteriales bacterium]
MTFTVVFKSINTNLSYMLCFEPSPIWRKFDEWLINLNQKNPHYEIGGVKKLLEFEKLDTVITSEDKECFIIVQNEGHGSFEDLNNLHRDLINEGFRVSISTFSFAR